MDYNVTYRKKNKSVQAIISYKVNGKWKQKSRQGFKTQKEAKPIINKIIKELEFASTNKLVEDYSNHTFKEITEMYLDHIRLYTEYNTVKGYRNCFANFTALNSKKIIDITRLEVQSAIDALIKKRLKQKTIKTYLIRLNTFFKYVKNDLNLIIDLPTQNIQIPKQKSETSKRALSEKELNNLMDHLKNNKFYIVAYIAANTGLRLGEILGLTWSDIDFKYKIITVNKQWKSIEERKSGFGTLKSKNSLRKVPVSLSFIKTLQNYKKNNPTNINNRIAPFNSASIFKYLNPELQKLAGISIHELRHTYATMLISNRIDFKTAAKILGHDVEQTLKTYSHVTDDMMKKAKNIIENIF